MTRIRPTPYADLHCGHAFVAWHNWSAARRLGGKFLVIFDEVLHCAQCISQQSWGLQHAEDRYLEDLCWLGMEPDEIVRPMNVVNAEAHAIAAEMLGLRQAARHTGGRIIPVVLDADGLAIVDTYHPHLVMQRVVDDNLAGVTNFWRGADLIGERQLYSYLCSALGYRPVGQTYLPVVWREKSEKKESKSSGEYVSVRDLRGAGYMPEEIIETLRECGRRSVEKGLLHTVIPAGILELGEIRTLPLARNTVLNAEPYTEATEWGDDVRAYQKRLWANYKARRKARKAALSQCV